MRIKKDKSKMQPMQETLSQDTPNWGNFITN